MCHPVSPIHASHTNTFRVMICRRYRVGFILTSSSALFTLHWHILGLPPQPMNVGSKSLEEWRRSSQAALDTVTKMVDDIANSHENMAPHPVDSLPPSYAYIVRAALQHIRHSSPWKDDAGQRVAEERLRNDLKRVNRRWGVQDYVV